MNKVLNHFEKSAGASSKLENTSTSSINIATYLNLRATDKNTSKLGNKLTSTSMLELNELQAVKEFIHTVEESLEEKKNLPHIVHDPTQYSSETNEDNFFFCDIEEEQISATSSQSFIPNSGYDNTKSYNLTSGSIRMAPLSTGTMNELNLDSLELEPSPIMKKSTSLFNMHDNSIHPINEEDDNVATLDTCKVDTDNTSTESESIGNQKPTMKRTSSFLKFVEAKPNVSHKHCSTLKPRKSAMKKTDSGKSLTDSTVQSSSSEESIHEKMQRKASFSTIEFRTYNVAIGDNPGSTGSRGTPVSLCWEYDIRNIQLHDLDVYEDLRPKRRSMTQLYLSPYVREWMLLRDNGYTAQELKEAAKVADKARKERNQTVTINSYAPVSVQQKLRGLRKKSKRILKA